MPGPRIIASARKHRVSDADVKHAWDHAMRLVEFDSYGEDRLLVIGPSRSGRMLELVAVPVAAPPASSTPKTCNRAESTT